MRCNGGRDARSGITYDDLGNEAKLSDLMRRFVDSLMALTLKNLVAERRHLIARGFNF